MSLNEETFLQFWKKPSLWRKFGSILDEEQINFIIKCQHFNGGFSNWPNQNIYLETCYYALICLGLSGNEKFCNLNFKDYIMSHRCTDGGFGDLPGVRKSNLFNTYYAVISLGMVDGLDRIDKERLLSFIISKRRKDGGFSENNNEPSSLLHSFWAIVTLDAINCSNIFNKEKIKEFIISCISPEGFLSNYSNCRKGYIEYTAYAIILNRILDLEIIFPETKIIRLIECLKSDKGYSSYFPNDANNSDTFWAIYIQKILGYYVEPYSFLDSREYSVWNIFLESLIKILVGKKELNAILTKTIEFTFNNEEISQINFINRQFTKSFYNIQFWGYELYKQIPLKTKKQLSDNSSEFGLLLDIDNSVLHINWENLFFNNSILQLKNPIIRKNRSCENVYELHINNILLVFNNLEKSSKDECGVIRQIFINSNIDEINYENFSNECLSTIYQIIHFSGHIMKEKASNNLNLIQVLETLKEINFQGLLTLNTCNVMSDLYRELKKCNFSIIYFDGELNGLTGNEFIKEVYLDAVSSNSISESIQLSKNKLLNTSHFSIDFLFYQYWGNPNLFLTLK